MKSRLTVGSFLRLAAITFGSFAIAATSPPATAPPAPAERPHIELDAPWTVQPNSQFDLAVEYVAGEEDEPAEVTMATTNGVTYSMRSMTLKPGETGHVTVTVAKTTSGLAQLMLMTNLDSNA